MSLAPTLSVLREVSNFIPGLSIDAVPNKYSVPLSTPKTSIVFCDLGCETWCCDVTQIRLSAHTQYNVDFSSLSIDLVRECKLK
jgi:hypothetical protein